MASANPPLVFIREKLTVGLKSTSFQVWVSAFTTAQVPFVVPMPDHPLRRRRSLMYLHPTAAGHQAIMERSEASGAGCPCCVRHLQAGEFRKRFPSLHSFLPTEIRWDKLTLIQTPLDFFQSECPKILTRSVDPDLHDASRCS